jgi:phage tail-like protein
MARARTDPYMNFNFRVEIDGIVSSAFAEVHIPPASLELIEYREGVDPACTVRRLLGRVRYGNLVLRRGITESNELFDWWREACQGNSDRRNLVVVLLDGQGVEVKRWGFVRALPARYEAPTLDASGNEVAIETLEIAFEQMTIE